ncbi:MAG: NAD(P)H-dependent oxidoreductase [Atopobiaceae bacterium]|nr:NAD(P)H-dependent oxidoreductase [Atopobiaceae bacterium]
MSLLFVNACLREGSHTERLARMWLDRRAYGGKVTELTLAQLDVDPLDAMGPNPLAAYSAGVAATDFSHPLFSCALEFAQADEVLIAAPMWNYSIPAKLHAYLELVCSQGVTFDVDEVGAYVSLCHIEALTFVTTAGGGVIDPLDDHCFGYVRTLARQFWHVPQVECVAAWGLSAPGTDVDALLAQALER